jgi:hypothetical protein
MWGSDVDTAGHGTHTSGTIAGAALGFNVTASPDLGTGIAPGAKLAFMCVLPTLSVSTEFDPGVMYDMQYEVGARITSNSWGGATIATESFLYAAPGTDCFQYDMYALNKPDMLHVFAAGELV